MEVTTENKISSAGSRLPYSMPTCELFAMPQGLALLGDGSRRREEETDDEDDGGQGPYAD